MNQTVSEIIKELTDRILKIENDKKLLSDRILKLEIDFNKLQQRPVDQKQKTKSTYSNKLVYGYIA